MNKLFICLILLMSVTAVFGQTNKVLLIGIDGCRPDAMTAANTPNLDALMANGTFSLDALNTGVTSSGPGWSSMLTGVWPEKHGVLNNSFIGSNYTNFPHLFKRMEEHNPALETVSIVQWSPINNLIVTDIADVTINVADHTDFVVAAADNHISFEDPDAIFLHFDDVDHAGHAFGFSPEEPQYLSAIETVDTGIGLVLDALANRANYSNENWAIIVSTDHGGIGTLHGGNTIEERKVFLIVSGDEIVNREIEADSMIVEIPPVDNCLNDTVELSFDGSSYVNIDPDSSFDFGSSEDFTVECWVRTTQPGDVAIVTDKDWDSGFLPGWVFSFNQSNGQWKVNVGDGNDRVDVEGNEIADGEWHMLSATFDRNGSLSIYEDGILVNQQSMSNIDNIATGFPLRFGADSEEDYGFTGNLSEVRIFSGIVSPSNISDWSCSTLTNSHPNFGNLVGVWKMNEGSGNLINETGPNNLNGVNQGGIWTSSLESTLEMVKNYANTPRLEDFMVSALEHLCIPIDPAWNLDGDVFGTSCSSNCASCISLDLNAFLQGPFDSGLLLMNDIIKDNATFPLEEPYSALYGTDSDEQILNPAILSMTGPNSIVDWIYVELRDADNPENVIDSRPALIQRDGDIVSSMDGISLVNFDDPGLSFDDVLVALRHRNHFGVRNLDPISLNGNNIVLNFSSFNLPIFGENSAMSSQNGLRLLTTGDANGDGSINVVDLNAFWRVENGQPFQYSTTTTDFNLDGFLNVTDKNFGWRPNNSKVESLD